MSITRPTPRPPAGDWRTRVIRSTKGKKLVPVTANTNLTKLLRAEEDYDNDTDRSTD